MIGMVEERAIGDRPTWVIKHNDDAIRSLDTTDDVQGYEFWKRRVNHSQLGDEVHANPHGMILLLLVILAVYCFSVRNYPGLFFHGWDRMPIKLSDSTCTLLFFNSK
jgi:hypothetical protein